jgi:phage baseplate assembly protein W
MASQTPFREPIGWPLLPFPDQQGRLNYPNLEESVREMIQVILQTRPGEQLMRPGFGAGLEEFVNEQNTITTRRRIKDVITRSLERWEPRIIVNRVDVSAPPDTPTIVRVEIGYQLKRTGLFRQMGLTISLEN